MTFRQKQKKKSSKYANSTPKSYDVTRIYKMSIAPHEINIQDPSLIEYILS